MNDENKPECVKTLDMYGRIIVVETDVKNLSDRLNRTETHLNEEITGLKKMIEMIRGQINKLELRLVIAVILATLAPDLIMKVIGFFG